jgi:hypothetical protein
VLSAVASTCAITGMSAVRRPAANPMTARSSRRGSRKSWGTATESELRTTLAVGLKKRTVCRCLVSLFLPLSLAQSPLSLAPFRLPPSASCRNVRKTSRHPCRKLGRSFACLHPNTCEPNHEVFRMPTHYTIMHLTGMRLQSALHTFMLLRDRTMWPFVTKSGAAKSQNVSVSKKRPAQDLRGSNLKSTAIGHK